jgi:hypothetical protein
VAVSAAEPFDVILRRYLDWFATVHPGEQWSDVRLVEERDGVLDHREYTETEMSVRFPNILGETRRDWVNMAVVALSDHVLVLSIEYLTHSGTPRPAAQIEVNFSGLPRGYEE